MSRRREKPAHITSAEKSPSSPSLVSRAKKVGVAGATAAIAGGATYAGYKYGSPIDLQYVPRPNVYPEVVTALTRTSDGLRAIGPGAAVGLASYFGYKTYVGKEKGSKDNLVNRLATVDYTVDKTEKSSDKRRYKLRKALAGAGLLGVVMIAVGGTSALEHEVVNGPIRPTKALIDKVSTDSAHTTVVLSDPSASFMDQSSVPASEATEVYSLLNSLPSTTIVPFNKELYPMDGKSALEISFPDTMFERVAGETVDDSCETVPVIVDDQLGKKVGDEVLINGVSAQVVGVEDGIGQMKRTIGIFSDTDFKECIENGTDSSYYGFIVAGQTPDTIKSELASHYVGSQELYAITAEQFYENNRRFWEENASPPLLQVIAMSALLGGIAVGLLRRSKLASSIEEIDTLRYTGVPHNVVTSVEMRRAQLDNLKAALVAIPFLPMTAMAFNAAESGLQVGVGPRDLTVGYTVGLGVSLLSTYSTARNIGRGTRGEGKHEYESVNDGSIRIANLTKSYTKNGRRVLDDIDYTFAPGKITSIVGESGAGKSTLFNLIAGTDKPNAGDVYVGGHLQADLSDKGLDQMRASMGQIFQNARLVPGLTGRENIMAPQTLSGNKIDEEWLTHILKRLKIDAVVDQPAHTLSGGEEVRVGIARALAHKPKIIIADEPTGGLDETSRKEVYTMLGEMVKEMGSTLVIITHDQVGMSDPDVVVRLRSGKLSEEFIKDSLSNDTDNALLTTGEYYE